MVGVGDTNKSRLGSWIGIGDDAQRRLIACESAEPQGSTSDLGVSRLHMPATLPFYSTITSSVSWVCK